MGRMRIRRETRRRRKMKSKRRKKTRTRRKKHTKGKIYLLNTFTPTTFLFIFVSFIPMDCKPVLLGQK